MALNQENDEEQQGKLGVWLVSPGVVLPVVLKSYLELHIIDIIVSASAGCDGAVLSPSDIASRIPIRNPNAPVMLDRMMRLLAGYGILKCSVRSKDDGGVERLYGAGPLCSFLSENSENGGGSISPLLLLHHDKKNIKAGWINVDGCKHWVWNSERTGMEHVGGDIFKIVPKGDAIFTKWILHDWSDEHCLKLLRNCWEALPPSGKVIIVESILLEVPKSTISLNIVCEQYLFMFVQNPGGKERTQKEFEALAIKTGFSGCEVICYVYNSRVMELHKKSE